MKNSQVIVMLSFNKQYGQEKEEKYILLTQRLSDQNSLSQTDTLPKKSSRYKKKIPKQTHNKINGFHMEESK